MSDFIFVYVTCENEEEAKSIATTLVTEKLAACANIMPGMTSIYIWQDVLQKASEVVMIIKTWRMHFKALEARIKELHSYETPCICAIPVEAGNAEYLDWIAKSTA